MRRRRIFTLSGVTVALGLAGVVASSTVTQASPQHTNRVLTLGPARVMPATVLPRTAREPAGASAVRTATNKCGFVNAVPYDSYKGLPNFSTASARRPFIVKMFTTQGLIVWSAFTDSAPCTTFSFRFLAQHDFYNGTHCHRLVTKVIFVLQCGDPTGTGSGAPGYKFNDENLKGATYPAGIVAMANAGPNTNGSQFFFNTEANPLIGPNYTPFGFVIQGMDVLRKIAAAGDDSQNGHAGDGYPHLNVTFKKVQIVFLR